MALPVAAALATTGRVLLVDGDRDHRRPVAIALREAGFDVVEVDDGARALMTLRPPEPASRPDLPTHAAGGTMLRPAVVTTDHIDVVVVSWQLPGLSGGEFLTRLRGDGDGQLVLVRGPSALDVGTILGLGADDVGHDHEAPATVVARVKALLRRRGRRQEPITAGAVLDRRYQLVRKLGDGRAGEVWRARHLSLDVDVDLAVVDTESSTGLRRDAAAFAAHSMGQGPLAGFVRLLDLAPLEDERHLVVSEPLPARTLKRLVNDDAPEGMAPERAVPLLLQLCEHLSALHDRGGAHGGLTPNAIYVDDDDQVRLVDGALLRLMGPSRKRVSLPAYVPPDAAGARANTVSTGAAHDVFAVSAIACLMMTGRPEQLPKHPVGPALAIGLAHHAADRCSMRALLRALALSGGNRRRRAG